MILNLFNIFYVLIAIAMIALILLQRGSGAQAGSGFGGGASGTVFGARGATTFLSRSTAILAALFFLLSLTMAWYLGHAGASKPADDLGVMSGVDDSKAAAAPAPVKGDVPAAAPAAAAPAPASDVPAAPAAATPAAADVPKAEGATKTEASATKPAQPKKH